MRVAILGAGPAGMSCANACLSYGLEPLVIEASDHVGGSQRSNFHPNLWMLGHPDETGEEMTRRLAAHFLELQVTLYRGTRVRSVMPAGDGFDLRLATPEGEVTEHARAIVLATGMRPRATPELEALAAESQRVIIGPLSEVIRDRVRNARVLILGGGDNALDHALFLAERGNTVRVCTRARFAARKPFQSACAARPEIELKDHCIPSRLAVEADQIVAEWGRIRVRYDWLLVMYGYRPNIEVLAAFADAIRPAITASGHIHVDGWQRTSVPGIYAAGDLTDSPQPSVPTAIAQGLAAAKAIERDLG
ncbi:MAG: NAD(P)/FAD-dependent oxidoreductase [Thiobacillaceae bacterium]